MRSLRKRKRLRSEYVAAELGITAGSLLRYERGETEPSSETWLKLANLYGVALHALMSGDSAA